MKRNSAAMFNLLSVGLLGLTALTSICYLIILANPNVFYNPFPPSGHSVSMISGSPSPTSTAPLPPTWTPTATATRGPTATPRPTRTPTSIPSVTPTWPPTITPTPRVTRAPYPFTCQVNYRRPEYEVWSGVAGHVEDLDGDPMPGYHVRIECPGAPTPIETRRAGANERFNLMYGSDAAWERACNPSRYQAMEVRVQLFNDAPDPDGTYRAVSEELIASLGGYASRSLGYVTCTLNWEEWQPEEEEGEQD